MKMFAAAVTALAMLGAAPAAQAATVVIAFDQAVGLGGEGTPGNTVLERVLGANARVTGIAYSATIESLAPRWFIDHQVRFGSSSASWVNVQPGFGLLRPGVETFSGALDLIDFGLDFTLNDDGLLRIEFSDAFNTDPVPYGKWTDGSFSVTYDLTEAAVPEPESWALMMIGFAAAGAALRRGRYRAVRSALTAERKSASVAQ